MKRRIVSLLLAAALVCALAFSAGAAQFSDLTSNWAWARDYILRLADLGYMNGYPDGTVRPGGEITTAEAIALLARFYPMSESVAKFVHEDFGAFVSSNVDPTLSWVYDEIETCLAAGILSEKELKGIRLTAPIGKETLAVLLVRALKLTKEASAADPAALTFDDVNDITREYRGHVVVLVNAGIINGDNHNRFLPKSTVTRAVVAAMMIRSIDYNNGAGRTLKLEGYDDVTQYTGIISSVDLESVILRDLSGVNRIFDIPAAAELTLNGEPSRLSDTLRGCYAAVRVKNKAVVALAASNQQVWTQGRLTSVGRESGNYALELRLPDSTTIERYAISPSITVMVDGEKRDAAALRQNMFCTLTVEGRSVTSATATSSSYTITGTITSLVYGTPVVLDISDTEGERYRFSLDLQDLPVITRSGEAAGVERLSVGDRATFSIRNTMLDRIDATSTETALEGVVKSVVSEENAGTTWVIQDAKGDRHSLTLDSTAKAYQGTKAILPGAIVVGDSVSVSTNGHSITEIHLNASASESDGKLTGTILALDLSTRVVTVTNSTGRLVYVSVKSGATILDPLSGHHLSLAELKVNDQVIAYGAYEDATNFEAASIILEV